MNLTFFTNLSTPTVLNKNLVHLEYGPDNIVPCNITEPCDVIEPIFILGSATFDITKCNYCYCDYFRRYYFIEKTKILSNGMVQLLCKEDILYTYSDWVRSYYGIIRRQENVNLCNKFIPDDRIVGRIDRQIIKKQIGVVGGNSTGGHICLTVTGGQTDGEI